MSWVPIAKGERTPEYYGSALRQNNGTVEVKQDFLDRMLEDDVLIPPGTSYDVQENDLDALTIEWRTASTPIVWYGRARSDDGSLFVRIRPDINEAIYLSCADYFTEISKRWTDIRAADGGEIVHMIEKFVR